MGKNCQTHWCRDLGDGGKNQPNDALSNRNSHQWNCLCHGQRELPQWHYRTCLQRTRPKPNSPPTPRRWRNKPMSMMTSNTKSTKNEAKTVGFVASMWITVQLTDSGDQSERTYGCFRGCLVSEQLKLKIHPCDTCDITRFTEILRWSVDGTYHWSAIRCLQSISPLRFQ